MQNNPQNKTKRKLSPKDIVLYALLAVFASTFIVCAVFIARYFVQAGKEASMRDTEIGSILESPDKTMNDIWTRPSSPSASNPVSLTTTSQNLQTPSDGTTTEKEPSDTESPDETTHSTTTTKVVIDTDPPEPEYSEKFLAVRKQIEEMSAQYPDIFGYISIPSLNIHYPLLQRPNDQTNSYYLRRAYDGTNLVSGSIFMDYRCSQNISVNRNTVIYGHNMRSGSMFGPLQYVYYKESEFENAEIIIATMDGIYTYKVFSVYRTTADRNYCQTYFRSLDEYETFINGIVAASKFKSELELSSADRIITLSTCTNLTEAGRYAVHGVLVKIET